MPLSELLLRSRIAIWVRLSSDGIVPVRLFDERSLRNNEKSKISEKRQKHIDHSASTQNRTETNDLHVEDVDRKLRDRSSEQVALCIAAKRERQREAQSIIQEIKTR